MKFFALALIMLATVAIAANKQKNSVSETKAESTLKSKSLSDDKLKSLGIKEDCDDKVKKPVEIKPESISLTGSAGCTLE